MMIVSSIHAYSNLDANTTDFWSMCWKYCTFEGQKLCQRVRYHPTFTWCMCHESHNAVMPGDTCPLARQANEIPGLRNSAVARSLPLNQAWDCHILL